MRMDTPPAPYTFLQLQSMWNNGTLNAATEYWEDGDLSSKAKLVNLLEKSPNTVEATPAPEVSNAAVLRLQAEMKNTGLAALLAAIFPMIGLVYVKPKLAGFFLLLSVFATLVLSISLELRGLLLAIIWIISIPIAVIKTKEHNEELLSIIAEKRKKTFLISEFKQAIAHNSDVSKGGVTYTVTLHPHAMPIPNEFIIEKRHRAVTFTVSPEAMRIIRALNPNPYQKESMHDFNTAAGMYCRLIEASLSSLRPANQKKETN